MSGLHRYVDVRAAMGFTPIHMAASQGHWQTVAALLANGASLAVRSTFPASCLMMADAVMM